EPSRGARRGGLMVTGAARSTRAAAVLAIALSACAASLAATSCAAVWGFDPLTLGDEGDGGDGGDASSAGDSSSAADTSTDANSKSDSATCTEGCDASADARPPGFTCAGSGGSCSCSPNGAGNDAPCSPASLGVDPSNVV